MLVLSGPDSRCTSKKFSCFNHWYSGEVSHFDCRNIGSIAEMRSNSTRGKIWVFRGIFPADFDCYSLGFLVVFQWIFKVEKEKLAAILCARLRENQWFTKKKWGHCPRPAMQWRSHKGASPLDPRRPPQIDILWWKNHVLGKFVVYDFSKRR